VSAAHGGGLRQLDSILSRYAGDRIQVGTIIDALGPSGWGLCLLTFGLPGLIPGVAPILGVALCLVAAGLIVGQERPWLPQRLRLWQVDRQRLRDGLRRLHPLLAWIERKLDRRGAVFLSPMMLRLCGIAAFVDAVLIVLPIPFGNTAPAIAVIVLALGLTAGDGVAVLAGLGLSVVAIMVDVTLIWAGWQAVSALVAHIL
jgi:hypothetical protein